ncbi:MAG: glycosyltransferase family 4 protein [Acidobacteriia bacterium]|nr:glycosyltransferase family 4 protein [Terriglobia bacterium]
MIRLFINGLAASAGGGLTYLRNVIPHLARRVDTETTVLLSPVVRREFGDLPHVCFVETLESLGVFRRFIREQTALPKLIRRSGAQVLISAGNFASWNSPVPQILLSRNSLYTSADFRHDVRARGDYTIWADTLVKGWLARRSIGRAEITVAPSEAFAQELIRWSGRKVLAVHHGFDPDAFTSDAEPLPAAAQAQLEQGKDVLRLLFVSHYNYYRNFETLFRALPILSERLNGKKVKLFLTCRLNSDQNPGSYRTEAASSLVSRLRSSESVVELGTVPYRLLHHLYRACHIYVTPAYAESFAHPLIESMSSGLPVVASDLPVHREICGDAAVYFPRFSPEALTERVVQIHESTELAERLSHNGLRRARDFSWSEHVDRLVVLAEELVRSESAKPMAERQNQPFNSGSALL